MEWNWLEEKWIEPITRMYDFNFSIPKPCNVYLQTLTAQWSWLNHVKCDLLLPIINFIITYVHIYYIRLVNTLWNFMIIVITSVDK